MIKVTDEEAKEIMIEILKEIHDFCQKNDITYYLCYGTLLGAIRHKGFIPWDDDIDIIMPRPDFIKFIKLYSSMNNKKYKLNYIDICNNYPYPFIKVSDIRTKKIENGIDYQKFCMNGIDVDVFALDGIPEDRKKAIKHIKKIGRLKTSLSYSRIPYGKGRNIIRTIGKTIIICLYRCIGAKNIIKKIEKSCQKYDYNKSTNVACAHWGYGVKELLSKNCFKEKIEVEFEGMKLGAPIGYKTYLTNIYGDYMQLPPVEKRVTHHENNIYWAEND